MSASRFQGRLCPPAALWPAQDRLAWEKAMEQVRGPSRAGRRAPPSRHVKLRMQAGYGRYLVFLESIGALAEGEAPGLRVSIERLDAYFEHLRLRGNADYTVRNRFTELRRALEQMCPGQNFTWITRPQGVSLQQFLEMRRRDRFVPGTPILLDWAERLFDEALRSSDPQARQMLVRDAVAIAMLATRAPRLRALCALKLGQHLWKQDGQWFLEQRP